MPVLSGASREAYVERLCSQMRSRCERKAALRKRWLLIQRIDALTAEVEELDEALGYCERGRIRGSSRAISREVAARIAAIEDSAERSNRVRALAASLGRATRSVYRTLATYPEWDVRGVALGGISGATARQLNQ